MKTIILAALLSISAIAGVAPANADSSFRVHGYSTHYGR